MPKMSAMPPDKRFAYWDCAPALPRAQGRSPRFWLGSILRCPQCGHSRRQSRPEADHQEFVSSSADSPRRNRIVRCPILLRPLRNILDVTVSSTTNLRMNRPTRIYPLRHPWSVGQSLDVVLMTLMPVLQIIYLIGTSGFDPHIESFVGILFPGGRSSSTVGLRLT